MKADLTKYPKLKEVSDRLGIQPFWLWLVIQHESGCKPTAINPTTGASGLIQFMPATARALGTSTASILTSDINKQLELVYSYLLPYKKKIKDIDDVYFSVFYPNAIGKSNNYILGSEKGMEYARKVAKQNPANNPDKDDVITVADVKKVIMDKAKSYGYNQLTDFFFRLKKQLAV